MFSSATEIYRHSDTLLKHRAKFALETFKKTQLYIKKVRYPTNQDTWLNRTSTTASRIDLNSTERIQKFSDYIEEDNIYSLLLFDSFLVDMGLVN